MNFNYTDTFRLVVEQSVSLTMTLHRPMVTVGILSLALLRAGENAATVALKQLEIDVKSLEQALWQMVNEEINEEEPEAENVQPKFDPEVVEAFKRAISLSMNMSAVNPAHLLVAILTLPRENCLKHYFMNKNINPKQILNSEDLESDNLVDWNDQRVSPYNGFQGGDDDDLPDDDDDDDDNDDNDGQDSDANIEPVNSSGGSIGGGNEDQSKSTTPALDRFGRDITKLALNGELDPVAGRELEIERVVQILSRRKKNNPVLIGEPGVGKSSIVEGLAERIVAKKVSRTLIGKRIISLDLGLMVAGTKFRGQFEERMKAVMKELEENKDIIVFIDEIHTIVGAGSAAGSMDTANMIKPALAKGYFQCIGATTLDEYRKSIEKDGALERRFQKILVEEPSMDETLEILHKIKSKYEDFHLVKYSENALKAAVDLTGRYVTGRFFPDKAIDAIDEAGASVRVKNLQVSPEIERIEKERDEAVRLKMEACAMQNFELATSYNDQERIAKESLERAKQEWLADCQNNREEVTEVDIARVVAMMTGVPTDRVAQAESERLSKMLARISEKVIGQDEAVKTIIKAIQRSRLGLRNEKRPIGAFLFLGSTGTGKTYLAKKISEELFGSEDAMIRIDMSEYMEKFAVSRLLGAPPGYIGYEEGGQLTERVRRKPYSVVLLDEIEKAHPDVYNILLQVLDEGNLTDSEGRKIDFKNTIIIITSNVGTRQLKDFGAGVGFRVMSEEESKLHSRSVIQKALNRQFSPEFLNRLDEIVLFDPLGKESIRKIVDIELIPVLKRIEKAGYHVEIDEAGREELAKVGFDVQYGARPLKRAIQREVEDKLTDLILEHKAKEGDCVIFSVSKEGGLVAYVKDVKPKESKKKAVKKTSTTKKGKRAVNKVSEN